MGETSIIEWTDSTQNFWRGCDKVDPTCAHCYMFREQRRYGRDPSTVIRCGPATFNAPLSPAWARKRAECIADHGRHLVFTCSWSDFFHEAADPWRDEAWDVIRRTPGSTYQILTSRPELVLDRLPADWGDGWPHVWMGVTIGNRRFVHRADQLRAIPAAVRFISAEPLLGPLEWEPNYSDPDDCARSLRPEYKGWTWKDQLDLNGIDWLIAGGESGGPAHRRLVDYRHRPRCDRIGWVRDLREACVASGTAFFFKQWGGPTPKTGGRELDGRTWDDMPRLRTASS
jgi:protein gp37